MTVQLTDRATPQKTVIYTGVESVRTNGTLLILRDRDLNLITLRALRTVQDIALDEDGGLG